MSKNISRREFNSRIAAGAVITPVLDAIATSGVSAEASNANGGFPVANYTPFGYLDNPYHAWELHRSGVIRSVPAIGFGFYYPAGPGGYFDYAHTAIYQALLRLGFVVDGRRYFQPDDFGTGLTATHHSKNLFTFSFTAAALQIESTFLQVGEDTLAAVVRLRNAGTAGRRVQLFAAHEYHLGPQSWWGRDGLTGAYRPDDDSIVAHSFAAGTVFALRANRPSSAHIIAAKSEAITQWMSSGQAPASAAVSYYPDPLHAALRFDLDAPAGGATECTVVLSRAVNERAVHAVSAQARDRALSEEIAKRNDDDHFWSGAPQLEGDWPEHWKHGWVYDFETLRMMVRRPVGLYRHRWDPMQIQVPRNVLAETSIDMWALSYADPESAKAVLAGQFLDAVYPNVPCMRENGVMNMIAADGSECGTSIGWCYPAFCMDSVYRRELDREWLRDLYPQLARFTEWTLKNRSDRGGFIVGKCSWETGMDASNRFLIQQPTGGELTEFVRVVELQAATAQTATALGRFATALGDTAGASRWRGVQQEYANKTQQLWNGRDWFQDFDTRTNQTIVPRNGREVGQCAPIFCGVARADQIRAMLPLLREYRSNPKYYLEWSSLVLPYFESLWTADDLAFLGEALFDIADRIYRSMDRREVDSPTITSPVEIASGKQQLGWPGVSCEVWGLNGAFGGEGYGWGAVMPAHIIRNLIGFRETDDPAKIWLAPNLPARLISKGASKAGTMLGVRGLRYGGDRLNLRYTLLPSGTLRVDGSWQGHTRVASISRGTNDGSAQAAILQTPKAEQFSFEAHNHMRYLLSIER